MLTPLRPCLEPNCPALVRKGRCALHTRPSAYEQQRPSASKRGYDDDWRTIRRRYAAIHPAICAECGKALPSKQMHLDHITPHKGKSDPLWNDLDNLQWLCSKDHNRKTQRETKGINRMRTVITGPPGVGKTTYVTKHRKPGDLVWDYDAVVATLFGLPMHVEPNDKVTPLLMNMLDTVIAWLRRMPRDVDAWIIVSDRTRGRAIAASIGAEVVELHSQDEIDEANANNAEYAATRCK